MHAQHDQLLGERDACTERKDGTRFEENRQFLHCHWFACSARRAAAMASRKGQNVRVSRDSGDVLSVIYTNSDKHTELSSTLQWPKTDFYKSLHIKIALFWTIIITIISSCMIIFFILHGMDCSNICHFKRTIHFTIKFCL